MKVSAIVTVPPYASFLEEVARHPLVVGLRFNTVMPLTDGKDKVLERLASLGKPLWVDLKGRQLRVVGAAIPPYSELRISHAVRVRTPVDVYFSDGRETGRIVAVEGNRLILEDGPRRIIGPGESLNIVHPSLEILGTLTATDRAYLSAMGRLGLQHVMLSYVESPDDAAEVRSLLPGADVVCKIESGRGLDFARVHGPGPDRLLAGRGDLYVEVGRPHKVVGALREILAADPEAIVASRLFEGLAFDPVPECRDITDAAYLLALGYRTFMLGDAVCLNRETVMAALALLEAVAGDAA